VEGCRSTHSTNNGSRWLLLNGDNCIRLPGKKLSTQLPNSILNFFQNEVAGITLIQTLGVLYIVDTPSLLAFDPVIYPEPPLAPTFGTITSVSVNVIAQSFLPLFTLSFSLQISTDNATWITIATNVATLQNVLATGLSPTTLYYFRFLSVNGALQSPGSSSSVTTIGTTVTDRETENGNIRITENSNTRITEF
jgi:hypothetical protein